MRFDVLTLFPGIIAASTQESILKRAQAAGILSVHIHDIRTSATDNHKTVDDTPYGGGAGMVLKVDVIHSALQALERLEEIHSIPKARRHTLLMCPQGARFRQTRARSLSQDYDQITLVCGHYEGFDERIRDLIDEEVSIGDFVLTGGELPAAMIIDAVGRLLPGTIHADGPDEESFSLKDFAGNELLEYPHYTRPKEYNGSSVPDILLSGNHAAIRRWRQDQAEARTAARKENP